MSEIYVSLKRAKKRSPIFIRITDGEMTAALRDYNKPGHKRLSAYYSTIRLLALAGF